MTTVPLLAGLAREDTLDVISTALGKRFAGGKTSAGGSVAVVGPTAVVSASPTERITVYWISVLPDPNASSSPVITVRLGTQVLYNAPAVAHWEEFIGTPGEDVTIELDQEVKVLWTVHYILETV